MSKDITVENVIEKLQSRFQPEAAKDINEVYQFCLEDADDFYVTIADQTCTPTVGEHDDPSIILTMDSETFIGVVTGEIDGMGAFLRGDLKAQGNIMLATKLSKLFRR
jgi:putative sterol carrier protein